MTVKTITITIEAYERLKSHKHGDESFSKVILKVIPKKATAMDWFGICQGTEKEAEAEIARIKKLRKEMSNEMEKRIERVSTGLYGIS